MAEIGRRAAVGGLSALALARCAGAPGVLGAPQRYSDRPEMMAIGDSLYQGVRTLSFKPGLAAISPPAQVAAALGLKRFVLPDPTRPILFDLEHFFFSELPILFEVLPYLLVDVNANAATWFAERGAWSAHEAFDNIAIGGAEIANLWTDNAGKHWATFEAAVRQGTVIEFDHLFAAWYALSACFTLNPRGRPEQDGRSPIDQVADRKPRVLLVNIGSNEGLFNGCFQGKVADSMVSLTGAEPRMDELARRLAELPAAVETIVVNGLLRPRFVPNLMPASGATAHPPGTGYYDAYGPWLFASDQALPGSLIQQFDRTVQEFNAHTRSVMSQRLGSRLVFVDLYGFCEAFDGKHYGNRGVLAGGRMLPNVPLTRTGSVVSGGMAGLDNMHPTGPGYGLIADSVLDAMGRSVRTDKDADFRGDSLLSQVGGLIDIADRQDQVRRLYQAVAQVAAGGMGAAPAARAAMTGAGG